jgi:hypothetical protein
MRAEEEYDALCRELCEAIVFRQHERATNLRFGGAPLVSKHHNAIYTSYVILGWYPEAERHPFYWWLTRHGGLDVFAMANGPEHAAQALRNYEKSVNACRVAAVAFMLAVYRKRRLVPRDLAIHVGRLIWATHDARQWGWVKRRRIMK